LRNQLQLPGEFARLAGVKLPDAEVLKIARAVGNTDAAQWLRAWIERSQPSPADLRETLPIIVRNLPPAALDSFINRVRERFATPENSGELLRALQTALVSAGLNAPPTLQDWVQERIADSLRALESDHAASWTLISAGAGGSPWGIDERPCRDGRTMAVLTSLPPPRGGEWEQRTGVLRSHEFACPAQLSFWICGHRGVPPGSPHELNYIRLVDGQGAELAREYPPRNDTAREVRWSLAVHAGKPVRLEVVDGDSGRAYAWLAVGRFSPAIVTVEMPTTEARVLALTELGASFPIPTFAVRLGNLLTRDDLSESTRLKLFALVARYPEAEEAVATEFKRSPSRRQLRYAEAMVATRAGAALLLGLAPGRLLTEPLIRERLAAWNDPQLRARLEDLVRQLPPAAPETDAMLVRRLQQFEAARAAGKLDVAAGAKVFVANCAVCHRIGAQGGVVGPQLDGTKNRGAERLCEDILDPNRAVDPAFRAVTATLKDDSAVSGLVRREDDAVLVLVDALGQEHTLQKRDLASRQAGALSLMPSNFAEIISETDFHHLIAWLLTQ
jgi:putative heme-binding domain-containing protein